jgi:hypothetical protein
MILRFLQENYFKMATPLNPGIKQNRRVNLIEMETLFPGAIT